MFHVPIMEVFHICHFVNHSVWFQDIRVVSQKVLVDNSASVVHALKVRVSEANEDLLDALLGKVVVEGLHGVGPDDAKVEALLVLTIDSVGVDLHRNEVGHLVPDLLPDNQLVWKVFRQLKHQPSVATTDVDDRWHRLVPLCFVITNRKLSRVYHYLVSVVFRNTVERGEVQSPIRVIWVLWHWNVDLVHGVDVSPHPVLVLLWHVHSSQHVSLFVSYLFFVEVGVRVLVVLLFKFFFNFLSFHQNTIIYT